MIYGYCRISRRTQNIDRQVRNISEAYPTAKISKEVFTGTKVQGRTELLKLLNKVKTGDTIVFDSVSRMSRNADEGVQMYHELFNKGVHLVFLKEPQMNTEVFKQTMDQQISTVKTGDNDADTMVNGIMNLIHDYMIALSAKQIRIAFEQAQKEVDDLHKRTSEGMETAKKNGHRVGTESGRVLNVKKKQPCKDKIREISRDFSGTLTDVDAIKVLGISRNTYYKYKRELIEEQTK